MRGRKKWRAHSPQRGHRSQISDYFFEVGSVFNRFLNHSRGFIGSSYAVSPFHKSHATQLACTEHKTHNLQKRGNARITGTQNSQKWSFPYPCPCPCPYPCPLSISHNQIYLIPINKESILACVGVGLRVGVAWGREFFWRVLSCQLLHTQIGVWGNSLAPVPCWLSTTLRWGDTVCGVKWWVWETKEGRAGCLFCVFLLCPCGQWKVNTTGGSEIKTCVECQGLPGLLFGVHWVWFAFCRLQLRSLVDSSWILSSVVYSRANSN